MFNKRRQALTLAVLSLIVFLGINILGVCENKPLPSDAAAEQTLIYPLSDTGSYIDLMKSLYNCIFTATRIVNEPLFAVDKELEVIPMGTEKWTLSDDGLTWTFQLRNEMKWSDGEPVTAHDYVFALQRAVEQGYDFGWYWKSAAGIKNWDRVEKRELPVDELGIKAIDEHTLEIQTYVSKPYLLKTLALLYPVPQHIVSKYGDEYATQAETMVGNGPFKVSEWVKGSHITCIPNPFYNGVWKPYLEKIILKNGMTDPEIGFPAYLNNEVYFSKLNSGQLAFTKKNIPEQFNSWPSFRICYLAFDTTKPPFNDKRVRLAFSFILDREELCSTVLKDLAIPEYSVLMSGFPGHDPNEAKKLAEQNIELAKNLLTEAGFPEGRGFPQLELWLKVTARGENDMVFMPAATYMQTRFKEHLGVDIIPRIVDAKTFNEALNQHTHNFFLSTYGFDYLDPSNFMDIFLSGGRHAWSNPEYDSLVKDADTAQEWEKRVENYRKAEQILIKEAPIVVIFQNMDNAVFKPYLKGEGVEPNRNGIISLDANFFEYFFTHTYVANK